MNFLEKIQNQPKHIRTMLFWLSFLMSGFFTLLIWIFIFDFSLSKIAEPSQEFQSSLGQLKGAREETLSLTRSLKAAIKSFFEKNQALEKEEQNESVEQGNNLETEPPEEDIKPNRLPRSQ